VQIDHERRSATFALGELAAFSTGPRPADTGPSGRWRAELGSHWHREKRAALEAASAPGSAGFPPASDLFAAPAPPLPLAPAPSFEVPIRGALAHRGWLFHLEGRLDQSLPTPEGGAHLRELKTTLDRLPRPAEELRAAHPEHFHQLGLYLALSALAEPARRFTGEVLYIEAGTGLEQSVPYLEADRAALDAHLDAVADFLEQRRAALARLRALRWTPAFATPRPGQETVVPDLVAALRPAADGAPPAPVVLQAPTGFGKTGVLLEAAFHALREGHADRLVYLTGKSTGQLHVLATLQKMLGDSPGSAGPGSAGFQPASEPAAPPALSAWNLRPKREHCVNDVFHCTRERCRFLHDLPRRWRDSGLARFHLFPAEARDLPALRAAGHAAGICPYEISRASLPFCDVWLGDFNYLFAPANRGVFVDQPTWDPARTLLVIDEAHHLPARVAEAHSHALTADELHTLLTELPDDTARPLRRELESLWRLLSTFPAADALDLDTEDDLAAALRSLSAQLQKTPPDHDALSPAAADLLWRLPALFAWMEDHSLEKLLWSPRPSELRLTCLDAAPVIGEQLRAFAGVVLATATPPPPEVFAAALGLAPGSADFQSASVSLVTPAAPWRTGAYDVALDLRVDTTYRRRAEHHGTTAATLAGLRAASPLAPVAAFFPSYAYAEAVIARLESEHPALRAALQPRAADLAGQHEWIEQELALADILVFVLGGSFAEGIDHLGGRVSHAIVVGPALPEVNALQRARQAAHARQVGDAEAFRRTYLVPGLQKVNQALGRLVRAPGQRARVVLHCRRFADPAYASLLAPEYQLGHHVLTNADLADWLARD
jgi:Rad3-related DNA helicase